MSAGRPDRAALLARLQRIAALAYPRRCPLCGEVLGPDAAAGLLCPGCAPAAKALEHTPPRLPATEHSFYAVDGAASAYYYQGEIRHAILRCKMHGSPWAARELADLTAIQVFGAQPAPGPGGIPVYAGAGGLLPGDCIVPVPPRLGAPPGPRLPDRVARRLGQILGLPVYGDLRPTRRMLPQKSLPLAQRLQNQKDGYALRPGSEAAGRRVILVDDVITSGATVSACALALFRGGAADVFAISIAADEEPAKR
ncbi:MAG TPA: ComF family protein [Candidatus Gemmiger faecigallinarum]|nr:ComF family protein [Candidatus Gemmiger faecigallinarum]